MPNLFRQPRFSLRTLLILMRILGVSFGYVGNLWRRVRHQRQVVAKIEGAGGNVGYNWEFGLGKDLAAPLNALCQGKPVTYFGLEPELHRRDRPVGWPG